MNVKLVVNARVPGWNHKRLTVRDEPDVTDKPLVESRVNSFAIEVAALRQTFEFGAIGLRKCHNRPQINTDTTDYFLRRHRCAFDYPCWLSLCLSLRSARITASLRTASRRRSRRSKKPSPDSNGA